jgi:ribosomal protein S21
MIIVKVIGGDINKALKRYKSKSKAVKMMRQLLEYKEYEKPTSKRRKQRKKAILNQKYLKLND